MPVLFSVTAISALAVAALLGADGQDSHGVGRTGVVIVFACLTVASECRAVPWLGGGRRGQATGSWIFAFALTFLAPPIVALLALAGASAVGDGLVRRGVGAAVFNASQLVVSLGAATLVMGAITDPLALARTGEVGGRWLLGAASGAVIAVVVNNVLSGAAVALYHGLAVSPVVVEGVRVNLGRDGLEIALAPLCALAAVHGPMLLPLVLLTVWSIDRSAVLALRSRHDAHHDTLTGLGNRRLLDAEGHLMLHAAEETQRFAVVHLDLDGFKGVNDRFGHYLGDQLLTEVGARLRTVLRSTDVAARIGGDEFVLLVGSLPCRSAALAYADAALTALRPQLVVDGVALTIGASIGVAVAPEDGRDLATLLRRADEAMYAAKADGGNRVRLFETGPATTEGLELTRSAGGGGPTSGAGGHVAPSEP